MNPQPKTNPQHHAKAQSDAHDQPATNPAAVVALQYARVTGMHDDYLTVDTGAGSFPVRRAVGCLLEPGVGDTVLVSTGGMHQEDRSGRPGGTEGTVDLNGTTGTTGTSEPGGVSCGYILHVLEHAGTRHVLSTGGDLEIRGDQLRLVAHRDLDCVATEAVHLASDTLHMQARTSSHQAEVLRVAAGEVQAHAGKANLVVRMLNAAYESVCERMKRQVVQVEETADVQVGRYRLVSRSICAVKGMFLHLRGEGHTKVEGKQIHLH